jgi:crotonobetainyl-CoA:carnitine CoA-transferase CaiB-like acyl-CoA transferase
MIPGKRGYMESFLNVPAIAKHPQFAARKLWRNVDLPTVVIQALLPHLNLRNVSPRMHTVQVLGRHARQVLAELGGTR